MLREPSPYDATSLETRPQGKNSFVLAHLFPYLRPYPRSLFFSLISVFVE